MAKSIEEQKELIVDAVLDMEKELAELRCLLNEARNPENKIIIDIFDDFLLFIYRMLWNSIVINISWLYEKTWYFDKTGKKIRKKKTRNLYWYLEEQKKASPAKSVEIDAQIAKLESLDNTEKKLRKFRNEWIAHRSKEPFENPDSFWDEKERLKIEDVETLIDAASEIIREHLPFYLPKSERADVYRLFGVFELLKNECPNFIDVLRNYKLLSYTVDYKSKS